MGKLFKLFLIPFFCLLFLIPVSYVEAGVTPVPTPPPVQFVRYEFIPCVFSSWSPNCATVRIYYNQRPPDGGLWGLSNWYQDQVWSAASVPTNVQNDYADYTIVAPYVPAGEWWFVLGPPDNHSDPFMVDYSPFTSNVSPIVGTIVVPTTTVALSTPITVSANFTDTGNLDTHIAVWDWGDGSTTTGTLTEPNGLNPGSVYDTHTYISTGVYTITLKITDNFGGVGTNTFQYISVYNPTPKGLFSGARIFNSPAGAYVKDANLTGKIMFGISVRYSDTLPVGNVSFDFKQASLSFRATSITSLVTSNGLATVRGKGVINDPTEDYTFLATGLDSSEGGPSIRFQIKASTGALIYDSQLGEEDTALPTAPIIGQVVVH